MFRNRAESLSRLIADNRLLEIAQLLDDEVKLKAQITDPALIDKETIEEVVTVAKKLASAGCPLQLVEPDEFLDIAQLFAPVNPEAASDILVNLQAKLEITDSSVWKDPVWTARVAAVVAYFSALKQ